jgi:hypothetical protein
MIVLRKTMDAALEAERKRYADLAMRFGQALHQTDALQRQLADWITEKGETFTPEQMAALFYSHDNRWQAAFFNALQGFVKAVHEALPPKHPNEFRMGPGVPYGETQWCWMADDIDQSGFETLEAMFEHAKHAREKAAA